MVRGDDGRVSVSGRFFLWEAELAWQTVYYCGLGVAGVGALHRCARHSIITAEIPCRGRSQKNALFTIFSFLNCTKYPPSLDFLLMTLGPALILLALLEGFDFGRLRHVIVFGRVPLFYYVMHIPLMHLTAIAISWWRFGGVHWFFTSNSIADFPSMRPPGWGFSLIVVYLIWMGLVAAMYPLCRWFGGVKRRNSRKGGSAMVDQLSPDRGLEWGLFPFEE